MERSRTTVVALAAAAGLAVSLGVPALGQTTRTFDNEDGDFDWYGAANWDPDGQPGPTDVLIIDTTGPVIVVNPVNNNVTVGRIVCSSGLSKVNGDFTVNGPSEIVGFLHQSCCTDRIVANASLRLEDALFFSRVSFEGAGPITVAGNSQLVGSPIVRGSTEVQITGDTFAPNGFSLADSSRLTITGELPLPRGGAIAPLGPAIGQVVQLQGGEIGFFDAVSTSVREVAVSVDTVAQGGTIYADDGLFELNAPFYVLRGTTVDVRNVGLIAFGGGSLSTEFDGVAFQGLGEVIIDTNTTFTGASTNAVDDGLGLGLGLALQGNIITFNGTLESTGNINVGTGRFEGPGRLLISGGSYLQQFGTVNVSTVEFAGGFADIRSTHTIEGETIISGGDVEIAPGGTIRTQAGGALTISGGTLAASSMLSPTQFVGIDAAVEMFGGTIRVDEGTFQIRADGSLFNSGTLGVSPDAGDLGTMRIFASTGEAFGMRSLGVTGNGRLEFGASGSGNQGVINVLDVLTLAVGNPAGSVTAGVDVRTRVQGTGQINNTGVLYVDSQAEIAVPVQNTGATDFDGFNAELFATFDNAGGTVAHSRDIRLDEGGSILNRGAWFVTSTANIIQADLLNDGVVNTGTWELLGQPGVQVVNQTIQPEFTNNGTVKVINGTLSIPACTNIVGGVLFGGTWETGVNGKIAFLLPVGIIEGGDTIVKGDTDNITSMRDLERIRDGAQLEVPEGGDMDVNMDLAVDDAAVRILGEALLDIADELSIENGGNVLVAPGGAIDANGAINLGNEPDIPSVVDTIDFKFEPARPGAGRATNPSSLTTTNFNVRGRLIAGDGVQITAQVNAFPNAEWEFEVNGPGDADSLVVTGTVLLDGVLRIATPPTFAVNPGDAYTLISATGGVTGDFSSVEITGPGLGQLEVVVSAGAVTLQQACVADLDGSDTIDLADLLAVLAAFGTSDAGDVTGDGQTDLSDLLTVLAGFGEGCPGGSN